MKRRGFSTYRRMLKGLPSIGEPRYTEGQLVGKFLITEYIGHSTVHPRKATVLSKEHHWYNCQCSCGTMEVRTQQQLIDKRRSQCCNECRKRNTNED